MKIEFENKGYIEIQNSKDYSKIFISIASRQKDNKLELIVNTVELDKKQFKDLVSGFLETGLNKE